MSQRYTVSKKFVISGGDSGVKEIFTVPDGKTFTLYKVIVHFPVGSLGELGIAIRRGAVNICPDEGLIYGDGVKFDFTEEFQFISGQSVSLYYKNDNATESRTVVIILEGVIE